MPTLTVSSALPVSPFAASGAASIIWDSTDDDLGVSWVADAFGDVALVGKGFKTTRYMTALQFNVSALISAGAASVDSVTLKCPNHPAFSYVPGAPVYSVGPQWGVYAAWNLWGQEYPWGIGFTTAPNDYLDALHHIRDHAAAASKTYADVSISGFSNTPGAINDLSLPTSVINLDKAILGGLYVDMEIFDSSVYLSGYAYRAFAGGVSTQDWQLEVVYSLPLDADSDCPVLGSRQRVHAVTGSRTRVHAASGSRARAHAVAGARQRDHAVTGSRQRDHAVQGELGCGD